MSNEVIWYDSSETGAPTLNNAAGSMLAVLDACLINGFNVKSVTSIVVAGEVATVTCTGHGYSGVYGKLVKISGATPAGLNGRKQITPTGVNSFTFPAPGISDQTATGTISARRAPLETWEKPYTGTNKAMYRSTDVGASGAVLRVLDTTASAFDARVSMGDTATDIDTLTNCTPPETSLAGGGYWFRGDNNASAKAWTIIGDGRAFWFQVDTPNVAVNGGSSDFFGDFSSHKAADALCACLVAGYAPSLATYAYSYALTPALISAASATWAQVSILQAANGVSYGVYGHSVPTISGLSATLYGRAGPAYPSIVDGGMLISYPTMLMENGKLMRGTVPGLGYPVADISSLNHHTLVTGLLNSPRVFLVVNVNEASTGGFGKVLFDLTGPWR